MRIVLCGGGSGGHITPLLAVASELRKQNKSVELIYIGERGGKFARIATDSKLFDEYHFVSAGKIRRYHGESFAAKLLDFKTLFLNFRDIFRLVRGIFQGYFLLKRLKPNSILLKGGFVCVPVALASRFHKIPYITHDSDALPGLANRIAARWARYHATGQPAKYYTYPTTSVKYVGVPSDERFRPYTSAEQTILKQKYHIDPNSQVLLIMGGSNGARRVNEAVINLLPQLMKDYPELYVFHQVGQGNEDQTATLPPELTKRVTFFDFSSDIFHMSAIADVIITRAGASIMADLAQQKKACIVIPNPFLTGGHQMKNAQVFDEAGAALIVHESEMIKDPTILFSNITDLLNNSAKRTQLSENLHKLNPVQSPALSIAKILQEIAK